MTRSSVMEQKAGGASEKQDVLNLNYSLKTEHHIG